MNNLRKTIEDRGESGDTFYGIKDYAEEFKPKIVILENVVSVPWTQRQAKKAECGLDKHFEEIGYLSKHVILDSKDYYVPQTRQRGYLVAIHRESFNGSDDELNKLFSEWVNLVTKSLKRPASVPAQSLLLKSDDPKLKYSLIEETEIKKKPTEWEKCKRGYELYQGYLNLGPEHPITHWAPGGFKRLPDFYKPFKGATDRVLDTIDIAHKRSLARGFDDTQHE